MTRLTLVVAALSLFACGGDRTGRVKGVLALTGDVADGGVAYRKNCASCHGPMGEGGSSYPALAHHFQEHGAEDVATVILNGTGRMVAIPSMSDQEIADVLVYGQATFK